MVLLEEDNLAISRLAEEIVLKSGAVTYDSYVVEHKTFERNYVGVERLPEKVSKMKKSYAFFSKNEVGIALFLLFSSRYSAKHIAKKCYTMDEDDEFIEEIDTGIPLGMIRLPNGAVMPTTAVRIPIKVLSLEERNSNYGMPFNIGLLELVL